MLQGIEKYDFGLDHMACKNESRINGKAIPLQAWTGPEGNKGLRLPHFKTVVT
jgi:hypothetical protein